MKQNVDQSLRKAASLSARGDIAGAEAIYRNVLERFPSNRRALDGIRSLAEPRDPKSYDKGLEAVLALYDQGRLHEVLDHLRLLIGLYPSQADLHNIAGVAFAGTGQLDHAVAAYDRAISLNPGYAEACSNRATALIGLQRPLEALMSCDQAIDLMPDNAQAHSNKGIALRQLGRLEEALISYDRALQLMPSSAEIHYNRANTLLALSQPEQAIAAYDRALALRPAYVVAHCNRGNALKDLKRLHEALDSYSRAIALDPGHAEAHSNLGIVMLGLKRLDEGEQSCRRAVELQPESGETHYNHAVVLQEMQRFEEALAAYDAAIDCNPQHAAAHANRGHVLYRLHRLADAAISHQAAVRLNPGDATGFYDLGNMLQELERLDEAVACYARATELKPDYPEAVAQLAYQRARMCDWSDSGAIDLAALGIATKAITPFTFLALEDAPLHHLQRARTYIAERHRAISIRPPRSAVRSAPIRIGYFSADFHDHATMYLIARLLELHDRGRFEVHAFSYGQERDDAMRRRARAAVHAFHEVSGLTDKAIADLARREGIDIAIDLKGHTKGMRAGIFSYRAAPVQIAYLGYPGSTGAEYMDYVIADDIVIPEQSRHCYAEKVISLPDSYQVNDDRRMIADAGFTRSALGLPESGFVFASFNAAYKIRPAEFDIWMRLLAKVDGSIFWLLNDNRWAQASLRREAAARGIDPARLIFAGRMPLGEHLARQAHADLFLDSFNCNAHTTASDALWAGLPVLTKLGESFAARVAGSLLHAVGLPELVTRTEQAYEQIALDMALNPVLMAAIRTKLAANRSTAPLFDTERYARHIETAFELAYDRYWTGLKPDHIKVPHIEH